MRKILVNTSFKFAVNGNEVGEIQVGEQEVTARCALVAVEHLGVATYLESLSDAGLRLDGPTIAEWVAQGYRATGYPPEGYESRSLQDEIDLAISAQKEAEDDAETDPLKMTVAKLKAWLTAKDIEFPGTANKEALQALVPKND